MTVLFQKGLKYIIVLFFKLFLIQFLIEIMSGSQIRWKRVVLSQQIKKNNINLFPALFSWTLTPPCCPRCCRSCTTARCWSVMTRWRDSSRHASSSGWDCSRRRESTRRGRGIRKKMRRMWSTISIRRGEGDKKDLFYSYLWRHISKWRD